jgi:hypothetical protein
MIIALLFKDVVEIFMRRLAAPDCLGSQSKQTYFILSNIVVLYLIELLYKDHQCSLKPQPCRRSLQ